MCLYKHVPIIICKSFFSPQDGLKISDPQGKIQPKLDLVLTASKLDNFLPIHRKETNGVYLVIGAIIYRRIEINLTFVPSPPTTYHVNLQI